MGHPDDRRRRCSARPGLHCGSSWSAATSPAAVSDELSHVGVGILVHHLGRADVGESVTVEAPASAAGRRVVFTCRASVGERIGIRAGVHHRALLVLRLNQLRNAQFALAEGFLGIYA